MSTDTKTVFAFTETEYKDYPGFINVCERDNGDFIFTVRSPELGGAAAGSVTVSAGTADKAAMAILSALHLEPEGMMHAFCERRKQIIDLERTLATKELEVTKLREALKYIHDNSAAYQTSLRDFIEEALSTPITTEALDSYVAEKVKEARPVIDGLIWAVAHEDNLSVGMLFDTPAQANAFVASVSASTPPLPTQQYCDDCDGCGWVEGGKAIQTTCRKCKGTGVLPIAQPTEQPK